MNNVNFGLVMYWLAQIGLVSFFVEGLIAYYTGMWQKAFERHLSRRVRMNNRIAMVLLIFCIGLLAHMAGHFSNGGQMMYHNVCLIISIFPLFDGRINLFEYLIRCFGMLGFWGMHHVEYLSSSVTILSLIALIIMLIILRRYQRVMRRNSWLNFSFIIIMGCLFWFTIPRLNHQTMLSDITITNLVLIRAMAMFVTMTFFISRLWSRQQQTQRHNKAVENLAHYDPLTHAKSYSSYEHEIDRLFDHVQQHSLSLTLVTLDIDYFKQVNDRYGHLAGNAVLAGVADLIDKILQKYHCEQNFYRAGGEEFNIIFVNHPLDEVLTIVTECWQALRTTRFKYNKVRIPITTSIGITSLHKDDSTIENAYKRADASLYISKRNGRDTITLDGHVQVDQHGQTHKSFAYSVQGIYDISEIMVPLVCNELTLHEYHRKTQQWSLVTQTSLSFSKRIELIGDVLTHSRCQTISLGLPISEVKSHANLDKLIQFVHGPTRPERLLIQINELVAPAQLQRITDSLQNEPIDLVLDNVGQHSYRDLSPLLGAVDGIKLRLQALHATEDIAQIQQQIRFWGRVAEKYKLNFAVSDVQSKEEVDWITQYVNVHFLQGDLFKKAALPDK